MEPTNEKDDYSSLLNNALLSQSSMDTLRSVFNHQTIASTPTARSNWPSPTSTASLPHIRKSSLIGNTDSHSHSSVLRSLQQVKHERNKLVQQVKTLNVDLEVERHGRVDDQNKFKTEFKALQQELEEIAKDREFFFKQEQKTRLQLNELEAASKHQNAKMTEMVIELQRAFDETKEDNFELKEKLRRTEMARQNEERENSTKISGLTGQVETLQMELDNVNGQLKNKGIQTEALQIENENLTTLVNELNEQRNAEEDYIILKKSFSEQLSQFAAFESENRRLKVENEQIKGRLTSNRVLEEKLRSMQLKLAAYEKMEVEYNEILLRVEQLEKKRMAESRNDAGVDGNLLKIAKLSEELGSLGDTVTRLQCTLKDRESELNAKNGSLNELEAEIDKLKLNLMESNEILKVKEAQVQSCQQQLRAAEDLLQQSKQQ